MGEDLIRKVASATGLPQDLIDEELLRLLREAGVDSSRLTLEDLRTILAEYVQDVLVAAKESTEPSP